MFGCINNFAGGALGADGSDRRGIHQGEPGKFLAMAAFEFGINRRAGAHQAGIDGGDQDVVFGQLSAERFGETGQSELTGAVGNQMRDANLAADGGNVDDSTFAAEAHVGQHGEAGIKRGPEVHVQGILEILLRHVIDRADADLPGVVDEHVESAVAADGMLNGALNLMLVGDVAGNAKDIGAAGGNVDHSALQFFIIASQQCDISSLGGELAGENQAQTARTAGDEDVSAVKVDGAGGADDSFGQR